MTDTRRTWMYEHDTKANMMAFTEAYLYGKASAHSDKNVEKLVSGEPVAEAGARIAAEKALFGLIINMIDNTDLVTVLATTYKGKGTEAIKYIKSCFEEGDQDDVESDAHDAYYTIYTKPLRGELTSDMTATEFSNLCNEMHMHRAVLEGTDREVKDAAHAKNLVDMVKKIDTTYKQDVRHALGKLSEAARKDLPKVQHLLTNLVRARNKSGQDEDAPSGKLSTKALMAALQDPDNAAVIRRTLGVGGSSNQDKKPCAACGQFHGGPVNQCMALLRSQGKTPPKWSDMSAMQRERIDKRAEKISSKGWFNPDAKIALLKPVQAWAKKTSVSNVEVVSDTRLYIDSQGGVGVHYHFIKERALFSSLDESAPSLKIGGVVEGDNIHVSSKGLGVCKLMVLGTGGVQTPLELQNCLYVPGLDSNIFNVWHAAQKHGVGCVLGVDPALTFPDGSVLPMLSDYTLRVAPATGVVIGQLSASVITRGQNGATHVDTKPLTSTEQVQFDLALQHLNDPAPGRAKTLHKVMDNVPPVLHKANYNNTATDARMLANAPSMPAPAATQARTTRVGELTQMDGWDAGCKSLLGNRYMLDCIDAHSTDISLYFAKQKSEFPLLVDRYFLELLQKNPDAYRAGGVLYSDNEAVLTSRDMQAVASKHLRTTRTAIEYRPTSNALAETGFRIIPNEMRKIFVRTGLPHDLFEFVAIEAERVLRWCRERDGKSPGEIVSGQRADYLDFSRDTMIV